MIQGIIGRKLGMTQIFRDNGKAEAVTAVAAGPCTVIQLKRILLPLLLSIAIGFYTYGVLTPILGYPQDFEVFGSTEFFQFMNGCYQTFIMEFKYILTREWISCINQKGIT